MTVRPTERKTFNLAALAASLALATGFVTAAFAAPSHEPLCSKSRDATLEVSENELSVTLVNHEIEVQQAADKVDTLSANHLLRPRAAATIREVFADSDDDTEQPEAQQSDVDDTVIMNTRVPGFSDDELARFKRQMLRKDI
ncbi:MAG: hypothetical protein WBM57_11155 [Woeseiaceae bacterium]